MLRALLLLHYHHTYQQYMIVKLPFWIHFLLECKYIRIVEIRMCAIWICTFNNKVRRCTFKVFFLSCYLQCLQNPCQSTMLQGDFWRVPWAHFEKAPILPSPAGLWAVSRSNKVLFHAACTSSLDMCRYFYNNDNVLYCTIKQLFSPVAYLFVSEFRVNI